MAKAAPKIIDIRKRANTKPRNSKTHSQHAHPRRSRQYHPLSRATPERAYDAAMIIPNQSIHAARLK